MEKSTAKWLQHFKGTVSVISSEHQWIKRLHSKRTLGVKKFYQHFTSSFFVRKCVEMKLFSYYTLALYFFKQNISAKSARKMLVKLASVGQTMAERE